MLIEGWWKAQDPALLVGVKKFMQPLAMLYTQREGREPWKRGIKLILTKRHYQGGLVSKKTMGGVPVGTLADWSYQVLLLSSRERLQDPHSEQQEIKRVEISRCNLLKKTFPRDSLLAIVRTSFELAPGLLRRNEGSEESLLFEKFW